MKITIKELLELLFEVNDERMTIKDLKEKLFNESDMDYELNKITKRHLHSYK